MRTTKSISTISYLTPSFFAQKVEDLTRSGVISTCLWVSHKGEGGDKDHIHVLLVGGMRCYDTEGLSDMFGVQVLPDGSKLSTVALWKTTKDINDWILYGIHDKKYLLSKGIARENHYSFDDICTGKHHDTDTVLLNRLIIEAKNALASMGDKTFRMIKLCIDNGMQWEDIVSSGCISTSQIIPAERIFHVIMRKKFREDKKFRNGCVEQKKFENFCFPPCNPSDIYAII